MFVLASEASSAQIAEIAQGPRNDHSLTLLLNYRSRLVMFARFASSFVLAAVALSAGTASASAISFASTTIDWSQFQSTVSLTYTSTYSIPIAEANLNGVQAPQVRNDLSGPGLDGWGSMSALNILTNVRGYGNTTANTVYAEGQVLADGAASLSTHASAFVGRGGYFSIVDAVSDLNFSVPYRYEHTLTLGSPADSAYAQSMLFMTLLAWDSGQNNWGAVANQTLNFFDTGGSGSWSSNGMLTLSSGQALAPGAYAFDISAFAAAAATVPAMVPEPSSLSLFSLALGGFAIFRRRTPR
jgi:hypothetical protein